MESVVGHLPRKIQHFPKNRNSFDQKWKESKSGKNRYQRLFGDFGCFEFAFVFDGFGNCVQILDLKIGAQRR